MYQIWIEAKRNVAGALRYYYSVTRDGRLVALASRGAMSAEHAYYAATFYMPADAIASVYMPRGE